MPGKLEKKQYNIQNKANTNQRVELDPFYLWKLQRTIHIVERGGLRPLVDIALQEEYTS